ncbi:SDR family oxidoreductase [Pseudomonas sp. BN415]|uniref:SDR family oxidoreductase n=1 Tax=Pseudomonas sp. BN415 TaxID=2567889 RepID=UPI002456725F|nr:SDR family oxidoreductase [Pseudomonas sp. BN415]MDH4580748.1 SDR family oxidoreductase [Pseudomonas sp. BN415]
MYSLEGQHVVIIGGGSGMGLATAIHAHKLGAKVTIASRNITKLEAARAQVGDRCVAVQVDGSDEASMKQLFEVVGPIDHIFLTAGAHPRVPVRDAVFEDVRPGIDTRFWSCFFACKYGQLQLRRDGSITFISGVGVFKPGISGESIAVAGAGAVDAFARSMALELRPIRVNALSPGATDTEFSRKLVGEHFAAVAEQWAAKLPVGRVGRTDDMAHAAIFLMTNGYVTGTTLHVEGGYRLV